MPEWDSAYGASSKASFDAGKAPKGTYGGNGNKSTVTHTSTGNTNLQKASLVGSTVNFLRSGNPLGLAWQAIKSPFKKKTEKEKIAANIKKGYDVNNPAEMHAVKPPRVYKGPKGNGGKGIKSLTSAPVTSAASTSDDDFSWNFQPYPARNGKFMRAKGLSGGKRFGPPPLKGPDPQGLDVLLSNSDYFKDLMK